MAREIYRMGQDIYNAATNQRIGATDWAQNWSGQSDVVDLGQRNTPQVQAPDLNVNQTPTQTQAPTIGNSYTDVISRLKSQYPQYFTQFSLGDNLDFGTNVLKENKGILDVSSLLTQQSELRNRLISSLAPSQTETDLNTQLADLRQRADTLKRNFEEGVNLVENKPMAMGFITGETSALEKRYATNVGRLADEEKNLLSRLGLLQDARKTEAEVYKTGLTNIGEDINLQFKVQDAINQQEKLVFDRAMKLQENSRQTLASILDSFKGMTLENLDDQTILDIQRLASQAGIPLDIIARGMETVANQMSFENLLKQSELGYKYQNQGLDTYLKQLQIAEKEKALNELDPSVKSSVDALSNKFSNEQVVKNFSTILEGWQFANSIPSDTKNPADNQALIYAFAKAMDPNSVVREGEYATVQRYSQSWLESFGFNAARVINNQEFLTPEAINNIKNTINTKFLASQKNYNNIFNEYVRRINQKTGGTDGDLYLTQYDFTQSASPIDFSGLKKVWQSWPSVDSMKLQLGNQDPLYVDIIDSILQIKPNASPDEIQDDLNQIIDEGFNQDPSMSQNGSSEIKKIASAIGQFESGGDYSKRGPVVTSGQYKGERAMGKYQIMPGNLPSWSKEALGRVVSEKEFMSNPALQDKIAMYQMDKLYKKYGSVEDVASAWFTGQPLARAGNVKDMLGTTPNKYVENVLSYYNKLG